VDVVDVLRRRLRTSDGSSIERLVSHARLPLVAGLDAKRPAVHVWDVTGSMLRHVDTVGSGAPPYDEVDGWERMERTPSVAWHPRDPQLAIAGHGGLKQWTVSGLENVSVTSSHARYRFVAYSPDGSTIWASPSAWKPAAGADEAAGDAVDWDRSDAVHLATGVVVQSTRWDTEVVEHPGGGLVFTLSSDQASTLGLFARVDDARPAAMRVLDRALILDADGYDSPLFSPDGRFLAIRGNSYEDTLQVFDFPSLRQVFGVVLDDPKAGQASSRSRHDIAFAAGSILLVGTPDGEIVEIDLTSGAEVRHDVLVGSRVTALAIASTGAVLVATDAGDLNVLEGLVNWPGTDRGVPGASSHVVEAFLKATSTVPGLADLEDEVAVTDGIRSWTNADAETATAATPDDPMWLRHRAHVNRLRRQPFGGSSSSVDSLGDLGGSGDSYLG
jgi:hypothetical protein